MSKKFLSIIVIIMILICITMPVANADTDTYLSYKDYEYEIEGNYMSGYNARIIKYNGNDENVIIPERINNYLVTTIEKDMFKDSKNVKSITIPASVTTISSSSTSSDNFTLESNAESISVDSENKNFSSDDGVLFNKDKTELIKYPKDKKGDSYTVPASVKEIGYTAFQYNNYLKQIELPKAIIIKGAAFNYCTNLKSVDAPNILTIESHGFVGCENLEEILMPKVQTIGFSAFTLCSNLKNIDGFTKVTNVGFRAFSYCTSLEKVELSNTITSVSEGVFWGCTNLKYVKIGSKITKIPGEMFKNCSSLETIDASEYSDTFCSEDGVLYSKDKTKIIRYPQNKSNSLYIMPDSIVTTDTYAFDNCENMTSVTISNNFQNSSSWDCMFKNCPNLVNISVKSNNVNYSAHDGILYNKDKTKIIKYLPNKRDTKFSISSNINSIEGFAFSNCVYLSEVIISNTVTNIDGGAFENCRNLKKIVIPYSVTKIGNIAFFGTDNVTIYCHDNSVAYEYAKNNELPYILIGLDGQPLPKYIVNFKDYDGTILKQDIILKGHSATPPANPTREKFIFEKWDKDYSNISSNLDVFAVYIDAYYLSERDISLSNTSFEYTGYEKKPGVIVEYNGKKLEQNKEYTITYQNNIEVGTGKVIIVGTGDYQGTIQKRFKIVPKENQKCGENVGWVIIGNTLKISGTGEMYNYNENNPSPWTSLYYTGGFNNKTSNITSIEFSKGITKIGDYAFYGPNGINNVTFSSTINEIGNNAFANCTDLEKIEIPNTVTNMNSSTFAGCKKLKNIKMSKNVKNLDGTFKDCTALVEIKDLNGVTNLHETFSGCGNLVRVELSEGLKKIGEKTFNQCLNLSFISIPSSVDSIDKTAFKNCDDVVLEINNNSYAVNYAKQNHITYHSNNTTTPSILPFKDVNETDWFYNAVKFVYKNGIVKGYNDITFAPQDKLTRGMIVTILYRMEGSPSNNGKSKFTDVKSTEYYAKAIKWAVDNGVVHGYAGTNKFGPDDDIIRQDLAGILRNYAKYKKKNVSVTSDLKKFKDYKKVDSYANTAMQWAVGKGVITGNSDGTLNPKGTATRAEVAAMIQKYCKKIGK